MTVLFDFTSDIPEVVKALVPKNGYCLMVDFCGSTRLKEKGLVQWIRDYTITFCRISEALGSDYLKIVGDMVMYWFPDPQSNSRLQFFENLATLVEDRQLIPMKMALNRCESVYEICFLRQKDDVFGADIDLTSRLLGQAKKGEIWIEQRFHNELKSERDSLPSEPSPVFDALEGPWTQEVKSFPNIQVFKYIAREATSNPVAK